MNINYKELFDKVLDGFSIQEMIFDEDGNAIDYKFIEVNEAFELQLGLNKKEIIGKKISDLKTKFKDEANTCIDLFGKVAATGEETRFEHYSEYLNKWYSGLAFKLDTNILAILFRDTTHEKLAELNLIKTNNNLANIIENMADAFVVLKPLNDSYFYYLGNKKWKDLKSKVGIDDIYTKTIGVVNTVLETGAPIEIKNCEFKTKDKPLFYNILIYKYNGGVALLGRTVHDAPSQINVLLSKAITELDQILEKQNAR